MEEIKLVVTEEDLPEYQDKSSLIDFSWFSDHQVSHEGSVDLVFLEGGFTSVEEWIRKEVDEIKPVVTEKTEREYK